MRLIPPCPPRRVPPRVLGIGMAWLALLCPAGPSRLFAGELVNAIHVRVNGTPVVHQDVQDMANLLVRLRHGGYPPTTHRDIVELEAEAIREQIRALLILEDQRRHNIRIEKPDYDRQLQRYRINPEQVSPAIRRWVEAQCVFPAVLNRNHIAPYQTPPQIVKNYYHRFRETEFREMGRVRLRRLLAMSRPGESQDAMLTRLEDECRRLEALPLPQRHQAVHAFIQEASQDIFAPDGGLVAVDAEQEHGWLRETLDYYSTETQEPLFPGHIMAAIRSLVQTRAAGRFTRPTAVEFGCLVIYLEAVEPGRVATFDEVKDFIDQKLADEGQQAKGIQWLRRKFDQSRITWNSGEPYAIDDLIPPHMRPRR